MQRTLDTILRFWHWLPPRPWQGWALFLIPAASILGLVVYVGAAPTHACGHDVIQFLDGAWRVLKGQRPHVDFYSPLGPLTYLVTAAGLALSNLRAEGVGYGAALFAALVGFWGYRLALRRMSLVPASLTGAYLVLLSSAPVPLGAGPPSLSHAMLYNRFGFALLSLVLLEVLAEPNKDETLVPRGFLCGFSTGAAMSLLLLLKASYFLVGAVLLLAFAVIFPRDRRSWLGIAAGAGAVLLPILIWLRFDAAAFVQDQIMTGAARSQGLDLVKLATISYRSISDLVLMMVVAMLAASWSATRGLTQWKWPMAAAAVFVAGVALLTTNAQDAGFPLSLVFLMLMASAKDQRQHTTNGRAACALAAILVLAAHASLDMVSLAQATREKLTPPSGAHVFLPDHMRGLLLYDLADPAHLLARSNGTRYVDTVNQGIQLLEARSSPGESVNILEQYNPFSYALARQPGAGGFAFLAYRNSFSETYKPPAERLFGGVDIVMVPKAHITEPIQYRAMLAAYLPAIRGMFTLAAETSDWWMYRRNR